MPTTSLKSSISLLFLSLSLLISQKALAQSDVIPSLDYMPPADAARVDAMLPDAERIEGGMRFRVDKKGEGPLIKKGDRVEAVYTGRLLDGTVFNRKTVDYHTYWFTVGAQPRQIIRGWEMAMPRMQKGGKYTLAIPAYLAYREKGRWGQVPPHATVVFEIEILDVRRSRNL